MTGCTPVHGNIQNATAKAWRASSELGYRQNRHQIWCSWVSTGQACFNFRRYWRYGMPRARSFKRRTTLSEAQTRPIFSGTSLRVPNSELREVHITSLRRRSLAASSSRHWPLSLMSNVGLHLSYVTLHVVRERSSRKQPGRYAGWA
jgi:hypothetical protein